VGGKPAYRLARGGETAQLAPRPVRVDAIEFLEATGPDTALLRIACGRGVYVRTLCHDLGARAGCPAHMRFLLRTRTGAFCLEDAVTLEEWMAAEDRSALLTPLDAPIRHLPRADVAARFAGACRNGAAMQSFEALDEGAREGGPVRVYCGGVFAGLARWREGALRFQAMLMD
jgi:tRNA pseudouridine55 synthase